jgi:hypothetical protein
MQPRECTVTFKCEGCGARKPEAERYRPRSAFTGLFPIVFRYSGTEKGTNLT